MSARRRSPEQALARAYGAGSGCPPPETFLRACWDALSGDDRESIQQHLARCPACSAERDLARAFDEDATASSEDVAFVVSRLEQSGIVEGGRTGNASPRPAARRFPWSWNWRLASAAVIILVAVAGWIALRNTAPPLPPRTGDGIVRGAHVDTLSPSGELETIPEAFSWTAVDGAAEYRIRLIAVDGTTLWETSVGDARAVLPESIRETLDAAVTYQWQVEAFDAHGQRLASSDPASFVVRPTPDGQGRESVSQ